MKQNHLKKNRKGGHRNGMGPRHSGEHPSMLGDDGGDRKNRPNYPRVNFQQQFEKYTNLAKDALSAGDRVLAEYHYQYADHYLRIINERNEHRFHQQNLPTAPVAEPVNEIKTEEKEQKPALEVTPLIPEKRSSTPREQRKPAPREKPQQAAAE